MTNIRYTISERNPDHIPRAELERVIEQIKEQMNPGTSIISGGGTHCDFYYGNSPIGFANVMGLKEDSPYAIRLTAPNKSGLLALTKSLGVPYNESRVDIE